MFWKVIGEKGGGYYANNGAGLESTDKDSLLAALTGTAAQGRSRHLQLNALLHSAQGNKTQQARKAR